MTTKAKKLLDEAMRLPPNEREALAGKLFDSLGPTDPDAEAAWQAEIAKRIEELDQGKVKPVPWSKARRMIFGDADDSARAGSSSGSHQGSSQILPLVPAAQCLGSRAIQSSAGSSI